MRKLLKHLLIAAFFVILVLPLAVSPFHEISTEKLPQLINDDKKLNTEFDTQMNDFVSDNQPFYDSAIVVSNFIRSNIFKSETANVITGKDGYYYYTETKDDILHADTLTDREIYNAAKTIELLSEYCEKNDCAFVFTVAPNKATVYPDFLPVNFVELKQRSNLQKLETELKNHFVQYADVKSKLVKSETPTYLKTDTHWNNYGALLAYNEIVKTAGGNVPEEVTENQTFTKKADHTGDLASMLYKERNNAEDQYYINTLDTIEKSVRIRIRGEKTRKSDELIQKIASSDEDYVQINASSSKQNHNGNLLMLRDSFCRSMFPYFAYTYDTSTFIKSATYDAYVNPCADYDCFVFEIVERNIKELLLNEQRIPAPERDDISVNADIIDKKLASVKLNNEYADYSIVSGSIDSALLEKNEDVFVKVCDTVSGGTKCYEAFVGKLDNGAFNYYLTTDEFINENSAIQIVVNNTIVAQLNV